MNNDLISRSYLKNLPFERLIHTDFGDTAVPIEEIDNAPTVDISKEVWNKSNELLNKRLSYLGRPQGEWIPVSERLPEKNTVCLVAVGKFNLTQIAVYSNLMGTINHKVFYQGDYGHENFEDITQYVNAWQPLPEPYKEGGAE